jgi:hypothetical protein
VAEVTHVSEVAEHTTPNAEQVSWEPPLDDSRVWVMRRHPRARLRQSHAIVTVDWNAGVARTSCGLGLRPDAIDDVPQGGCMPCVLCIAATPLPA